MKVVSFEESSLSGIFQKPHLVYSLQGVVGSEEGSVKVDRVNAQPHGAISLFCSHHGRDPLSGLMDQGDDPQPGHAVQLLHNFVLHGQRHASRSAHGGEHSVIKAHVVHYRQPANGVVVK